MAKVVSTMFSEMRGSVAGTTYLTTPAGAIIARARTHPVNPQSLYQNSIRGGFAAASVAWFNLDPAWRTAWQAWEIAHPRTPAIDARQEMIGAQSLFNYAETIGAVPGGATKTPNAPLFTSRPTVIWQPTTFVGPGTGVAFKITNPSKQDILCVLELSPAFPVTRNFFIGPWMSNANQTALVQSDGGEATIEFSLLTAGSRYFARCRGVTADAEASKQGNVVTPAVITHAEAVETV